MFDFVYVVERGGMADGVGIGVFGCWSCVREEGGEEQALSTCGAIRARWGVVPVYSV